MAARTTTKYRAVSLAATTTLAGTTAVELRENGHLSINASIYSGAGIAPVDTPVGVWQLWFSGDGTNYDLLSTAATVAELALIAPNGNNLVDAWAVFSNAPGKFVKVLYIRSSGGATAKANLHITTN